MPEDMHHRRRHRNSSMVKRNMLWKRFSTVASSTGSSSTWSSGKVMVWSTTLGEYWDNVGNAADTVNDFHTRNPGAPRRIRALAFGSIPFCPIPPLPFALGRCNSERGVIVRGTPKPTAAPHRSAKPNHRPSRPDTYQCQPTAPPCHTLYQWTPEALPMPN